MIKIVYMGSPEIAVKSLDELCKSEDIEVSAVVTQIDRPKGRGNKLQPTQVGLYARNNGIKLFKTEKISKDEELKAELKKLQPDFFVTFAFGQILSQDVLDIPKFSTVNLHASLLPKYRGANPIQRCLYNGDKKTGITTMITVLELDAGDICENCEINIDENMTDSDLKGIISEKSPALICSTLRGLYCGSLKPHAQSSDGVTVAKKFAKEDGIIDWEKPADIIHNTVRCMTGSPCARTKLKSKMLKVMQTRLCETASTGFLPGETVCCDKTGITVATGSGCIKLTRVKPESKNEMNAYDFANGAGIKEKTRFGEQ